MATFEFVALVTDEAKRRIAHMCAVGKAFKVTGFTVGNKGHDPTDPFNALAPDPTMLKPNDETVYPPIAFTSVDESTGAPNPKYICTLAAGRGTGVVSSLYLYATVVYDPTTQLPTMTSVAGVVRYIDLPSGGNSVGDKATVLQEGLDYYWNGTTWLPVQERFLFAVAHGPQLIKLHNQGDTYEVYTQF